MRTDSFLKALADAGARLSIRQKLLLSVSVILFISFIASTSILHLLLEKRIEAYVQNELKYATQTIRNIIKTSLTLCIQNHLHAIAEKNLEIIQYLYKEYQNGRISENEAKQKARTILLSQSIGKTGYIFVWDIHKAPESIPLVVHPKIEGQDVAYVDFVKIGAQKKTGYMEYRWKNPDEQEFRDKAMYLEYFQPWQWVIAASSYREEFHDLIRIEDFQDTILSFHFGTTGYPFIIDGKGNVVVHPKLKGNFYDAVDSQGKYFIREICAQKNGSLSYTWKNPDEATYRKKVVFFNDIPEYNWIVASSAYMEELFEPFLAVRNILYATLLVIFLVSVITLAKISSAITRPIRELTADLALHGVIPQDPKPPGQDEVQRLSQYFEIFMKNLSREKQIRENTETALQESEQKFMDIFYSSDDAILLLDGDIFVDCNDAAVKMLKCATKADALSLHPSKLSPESQPDGRPSFEKANEMIAIAFERGVNRFEWIHRRNDGQDFPVEVTLIAIPFKGKQVLYVVWKDITEVKIAEQSLQKLNENREREIIERTAALRETTKQLRMDIAERERAENAFRKSEIRNQAVLEANPDPMVLYDMEGKVVYFNPAFTATFGWHLDELRGKKLDLFVPEENWPETRRMIEMVIKGKSFSGIESCRYTKNGVKIPVSISGATHKDLNGESLGSVINIRDISKLKQTELELTAAKEAAETANLAKTEFLAHMSHEIRTPMNGVIGMTELLLATPLSDEQNDFAQTISTSANALLNVINDILDVSKIEAGKLALEIMPFNLRLVLEEISDILSPKVFHKKIELAVLIDPELPPMVKGDPGRLRQVIINLAGNAIKFTEQGEVMLKFNRSEETSTHVGIHFSVTDTGIGISEADQQRLFLSFAQIDPSANQRFGGSGLGLAISKRLIEMMGGKIGVESMPGKGSTFWFSISLEKEKTLFQDRPLPDAALIKGKRILAVDDHTIHHEVLQAYLKSADCNFYSASTAKEAMKLLRLAAETNGPFDVVLIDNLMPGIQGEELVRTIKNDPCLAKAKLVVLTGSGLRGDAAKAKKAGFDAYLTKPIKQYQLIACLMEVLGNAHQSADIKSVSFLTRHSLKEMQNANVKILLVEDNIINQKLESLILEKFGFRVTIVSNGREAIQELAQTRYELVLMDVQMPVLDGFATTQIIRDPSSEVLDHNVPIIAMTAHAMKGHREECIQHGMNDYLTKPIQTGLLYRTIRRFLDLPAESTLDT